MSRHDAALSFIDHQHDKALREQRIIHDDARKIIAGIVEADLDPTLSWSEICEKIDIMCWALGFEVARELARDREHMQRWKQSKAIARSVWEATDPVA
jgi:hypothetical protein